MSLENKLMKMQSTTTVLKPTLKEIYIYILKTKLSPLRKLYYTFPITKSPDQACFLNRNAELTQFSF